MPDPTYNSNVFDASQIAQGSTIPERWSHENPVAQTIRNLWIPNTISSIGNLAFARCPNLETVEFEKGGQSLSLGLSAFFACPKLACVHLPSHIRFIDRGCFRKCSQLEDFTIAEGCYQLEIPDNLVTVFEYCPKAEEFQEVLRRAARAHAHHRNHGGATFPLLDELLSLGFNEEEISTRVKNLFEDFLANPVFPLKKGSEIMENAWVHFEKNWNNPERGRDFCLNRRNDPAKQIASIGNGLHISQEAFSAHAEELIPLYEEIRNLPNSIQQAEPLYSSIWNRYSAILTRDCPHGDRPFALFHRTVSILRPDLVAPWIDQPSMNALFTWLHGDPEEYNQDAWFRHNHSVWMKLKAWIPLATRGQLGYFVSRLAEAFNGTLREDHPEMYARILSVLVTRG